MKTLRFFGGLSLSIVITLVAWPAWSQSAGTNYLVTFGSVWKYLDNGSNQGTAWREAAFDDSTWPSGPGQLGFGDGDEATMTQPGPITTYFRRPFMVDNPGAVGILRARVLQDDGCVIYLNGTEIFRGNMPAGAVAFNTLAVAAVENQIVQFSRPASVLAAGLNWLAVEMHQNSTNSGDLSFDFELSSINSNQPPALPVITVLATDPQGTEIPPNVDAPENPAVFRIYRSAGPTNSALSIAYSMSGTAVNGVDYVELSGTAEMAAGAEFAEVVVHVISDGLAEGTESVVLSLNQPACCYTLGSPSSGTATISDWPIIVTNELAIVDVVATDSDAAESGVLAAIFPGRFTFYRRPVTSNVITVSFALSGTAANGLDYSSVSNTVRFNPGQAQTHVDIIPRNDGLVEGTETVVLTLQEPACAAIVPPPPGCYRVGTSNQATVFIRDSDVSQNQRPYVQLNEPQNGDVFISPTNIVLRAFAHDQEDGYQLVVEFFAGTNRLGQGLFVPTTCPAPICPYYQLIWTNPPPGTHTLFARATDSAGASSNSAPVTITVQPREPGTNVTLIANGSVWKYLDNGSDQGTAWRQVEFNDSAWASGPAQLGYGDGDEATVVGFGPDPMNKFVTTYFRRSFNVVNAASFSELRGSLLQDDGGALYLNGVEVFRSNLPGGPIGHNTFAVVGVENQIVPFSASGNFLREGLNVVAVEMHQNNVNSTDLSFDLELIGIGGPQPPELPVVNVVATDSDAAEIGPVDAPLPGTFTFYRQPVTSNALTVRFALSGTADNGADYMSISNTVRFNPGQAQARVDVFPRQDNLVEGTETVVLTLQECAAGVPPPGCYRIGSSNQATVFIRDGNFPQNQRPYVQLNEPQDGDIFTSPTNIVLRAFAHDQEDGHQLTVEFFAGTNRLGVGAFVPALCPSPFCPYFQLVWTNPPPGNHTLFARATDSAGASSNSAPVTITVQPREPGTNVVTLVANGSVWKYLDNGSDQGTAWRQVAFNDSTWASGPAQLGYGDGDEATVVSFGPDPMNKHITTYFRRSFNVVNAASFSELRGTLRQDDGGAVYLNGVEVFRGNLPAGPIAHNTLAVAAIEDQIVTFSASGNLLREGLNVVAVEMHQVSGASSDLSFDLELIGAGGPQPPQLPVVNVVATDADAGESGLLTVVLPGTFTFYRSPVTSNTLTAFFTLSGSAENGVDYIWISNSVRFNPGQAQARVDVYPLSDNLIEGTETVVLTLQEPGCIAIVPPPPGCYRVGPSNQATVFIQDANAPQNQRPYVQLNEPQNGDVFTAPTNIVLRAYAQDAEDGYDLRVEFFAGTNRLGVGTFVPTLCPAPFCPYYELTWSNPPPGNHTLIARATDRAGASSNSAPVSITVRPSDPGTDIRLVANGSVWKYLDNGTDQGAAWRQLEFNDSAWASGPAQLGYGDGDEATVVSFGPNPMNKYITTYFRRSFNVVNAASFTELRGNLLQDDGAVMYLNGVEVFRSNLPPGPITYTTLTTIAVGDNQIVPFTASGNLLREGLNVVAVEMHQVTVDSSDLSFDLELIGTGVPQPTNRPPEVRITAPANGSVFEAPASIRVDAVTTDADGYASTVEFFANDHKIGERTVTFVLPPQPGQPIHFEFTWDSPPLGQHRLTARTVDNRGAGAISEPVNITVRGRPADDRELHVVGIHEGRTTNGAPSQSAGHAAVRLDRPGKRVTLFLSAYSQVTWLVTVTEGTILEKVVLVGYYPGSVQGIGAEVEVVREWLNYFIGATLESGRFYRVAPKVRRLTGLEISSFHGNYAAPYPTPFVIDNTQNDLRLHSSYPVPTPLSELPELRFELSFQTGPGVSSVAYTLGGPTGGGELLPRGARAVPDENKRYYYALAGDSVVQIDSSSGEVRELRVPPDLPEVSVAMGVAYDTTRQRLLLVTLGGEGHLYAYTPAQDRWSVLSSMNGLDLASLTYHASEDALYGMAVTQPDAAEMIMHRLNPDGSGATESRLPLYPWGIHMNSSELVAVSDYLVLLLRPSPFLGEPGSEDEESRMYLIRPATGQVWLTVRQPVSIPPNQPPEVSITAPAEGTVFPVPATVQITAVAIDYDNYASKVEFFANGMKLGETMIPPETGGNVFNFTWRNVQSGNYALTAKATDLRGGVGISPPVNIRVGTNVPPIACPCDGPWPSHGEYVACVIRRAWTLYRAGQITATERREMIRQAIVSNCGRSPDRREPVCIHLFPLTLEECQRDGVQFVLSGDATGPCTLEWSEDLVHWTPMASPEAAVDGWEISCPVEPGTRARFYRARTDEP